MDVSDISFFIKQFVQSSIFIQNQIVKTAVHDLLIYLQSSSKVTSNIKSNSNLNPKSTMASQLPAPRVVYTTHKNDGVSIFALDTVTTPFQPFGPGKSAFNSL